MPLEIGILECHVFGSMRCALGWEHCALLESGSVGERRRWASNAQHVSCT